MARSKFSSPTLALKIGAEQWQRARKSSSGGCLVADAIAAQYPHLTKITVDMATVRVTDSNAGKRYTYLTPPIVQHLLLAFDQGWRQPAEDVAIKRAVKITPITREKSGPSSAAAVAKRAAERRVRADEKLAAGDELTRTEKAQLTKDERRAANPPPARPTSPGPPDVDEHDGGSQHGVVVHGGRPLVQGAAHPNLLRGRDRHFGAKLAAPGEAFQEAVEAAVAQRLAERDTLTLDV